jgi:hypothetical protein
MKERDRRNLNPHKSAIVAMWHWGEVYSRQGGGSMDFWDKLSKREKDFCRDLVKRLEKAPVEDSQ